MKIMTKVYHINLSKVLQEASLTKVQSMISCYGQKENRLLLVIANGFQPPTRKARLTVL